MKFFYFLLLILAISCVNTKYFFDGKPTIKYEWRGKYEGYSSLELKNDSTFIYQNMIGLGNMNVKGKWNQEGNNIILNSRFQPSDTGRVHLRLRSNDQYNDSLAIIIQDYFGKTVPNYECLSYKNNQLKTKTRVNYQDDFKVSKSTVDSILIYSHATPKVGYKIEKNVSSVIIQLLPFEVANQYRYFTNKEWKLGNNKILDPSKKRTYYSEKGH